MSLASPLESELERDLAGFLADAATRGERIVCLGRAAIALVSLARSLAVWTNHALPFWDPRVVIGVGLSAASIAFSLWVFLRYRTRVIPPWVLAGSVTVDALMCFGAVVTTPLWPDPGYTGLIHKPDLAAPLVVGAAAGLRLSPALATWGGLLGLVSVLALVSLDAYGSGPSLAAAWPDLSMVLFLQVALSAVAVAVSIRTQRLVRQGAQQTLRVAQAERHLGSVVHDEHDVRTLLSSASMNADLLRRRLQRAGADGSLLELAEKARLDMKRVNELVASLRDRSYEQVLRLQSAASVDAHRVFERVQAQLRDRFPEVAITIESGTHRSVEVVGGERAMARLALNLLVNACEGNGRSAASRVEVHLRSEGVDQIALEVRDNGPGFPPSVLDVATEGYTTKRDGSGLGLAFVREVVSVSGGALRCENPDTGGALVSVVLRAPPSTVRRPPRVLAPRVP